ncbi:MAG: DUF3108 domain-containing protein [Dissulfurimicrobium sp.]|uniref:DUF3108 domain-containing protein n=1 Tax=Dissulfurimicrobium hydrothermale TaxID=1750598 RepID=UPI003C762A8D
MLLAFFVTPMQASTSSLSSLENESRQEVPQEELRYRITWSGIPAGEAVLDTIKSGQFITYRLTARSLPYIDAIYPVRIHEESIVTSDAHRPVSFYKRSREGLMGKEGVTQVLFNAKSGYVELWKNGRFRGRLIVSEDVQDPLSCLFWYRTNGKPEHDVRLRITDGKKIITGTAHMIKREEIETPAGIFDTFLLNPRMEGLSGVFKKSPGAEIMVWLTDDARKIPVLVKSKVVVGYFSAELISR